MRPDLVVLGKPAVEVALQFVDAAVDLLAEGDLVELVQDGLLEPLADAIRLRALRPGSRVIHVLDGQVELILVPLGTAAELGAAVGQDPQQRDAGPGQCPEPSKKGITRSFSKSAAVIGVLRS